MHRQLKILVYKTKWKFYRFVWIWSGRIHRTAGRGFITNVNNMIANGYENEVAQLQTRNREAK